MWPVNPNWLAVLQGIMFIVVLEVLCKIAVFQPFFLVVQEETQEVK